MSAVNVPMTEAMSTDDTVHTRLHNPWLTIARAMWVALVLLTVVLFAGGLLVGLDQLHNVCTGKLCHPVQLSVAEAELNRQLGLSLDFYAWYTTITFAVFGFVLVGVGVLTFWRRSDDWMALFVSLCLVMVGTGALPVLSSVEMIQPQWGWVRYLAFLLGTGSLPVLLAIFPEGRFVPRSMRWLILIWLAFMLVNLLAKPIARAGIMSGPPNPLYLGTMLAGGCAQVYRYRRVSSPLLRQQTKWVMLGFVGQLACLVVLVSVLVFFPVLTSPGLPKLVYEKYAFAVVGLVPILFIPVTLAISILRYRLWDIDIVINRTLVYGSLTALVVGIYVVLVGSLGTVLQTGASIPVSLFATGIVATSFQPLRERLQRGVNRLMFGERDDPYAVLGRLSERLEVVVASHAVLPTIVETVAEALKLPYAAIALKEGEHFTIVAEYTRAGAPKPKPSAAMEILPLVYQLETMGRLILAPRAPGEPFSPTDRRLLETIARQAGIAAYNVRLTLDLQRSRERLVTTREEERRRLRRDLHDGLGPVLASMSFKLDAVHNLADPDPTAVKKMAADLKTQMQAALMDIRRIAYNLRPPALDELGLVGALKEHIASNNQVQGLQITLEAPECLPPLTAAVEVAAYRIVLEALTNVSRHARAQHCCVRLSFADGLCLEVTDDGRGLPDVVRGGVGLTSMRERAEELGGTCVAEAVAQGGTGVRARLPSSAEHSGLTEETQWTPSES
jgi:signal transduction histidine kinase